MRKVFEILGFITLVCFSFFYTEKALTVVKELDPIRQEIYEILDLYNVEAAEAEILNDSYIIPGYNGLIIDVEKSYNNMKRLGTFNEKLLIFKEQAPILSINNIYDKYIISGNKIKGTVSLVFKVDQDDDIQPVLEVLKAKQVMVTFFIDGKWLENNWSIINKLTSDNHELANLGYEGNYDEDFLLWTNNKLKQKTDIRPKYCYVEKKNNLVLNLCGDKKMHTIKPTIVVNNSPYREVKKELMPGNIISFNITNNVIRELPTIINYIKMKGYKIEPLVKHLDEKHQ
ncbi:MAG: polysaccharide deacetylase family protein [Bacilli bacterium]|jgi:hypothetical protein|nr:polysaccharide deacetylase family protein [Bacilli bacterium]